jgi:hypothetical protein
VAKAKAKRRQNEGIVEQIDRELEEERQRLAAKDAALERRWGPAVEPVALVGVLAAVFMLIAQLNPASGLAVALFSTGFNAVGAYARVKAPKAAERTAWLLQWPGLLFGVSALITVIRLAVMYR